MKALVIGASGFIGSALVRALAEAGHSATALARHPPHSRSGRERVKWVGADLRSALDWDDLLAGVDTVFHLAWTTLPGPSNLDPFGDAADNVLGSLRLMEALKGRDGIRTVFASSGGTVYGKLDVVPADESHRLRPRSAYGVSKLAVEKYFELYRHLWGLDSVSLRISNPYGPGQTSGRNFGAVSTFAQRALDGLPIAIFGDGSVVRDFLHISDAVSAIMLAAVKRDTSPALNIGSGVGHSLADAALAVEEAVGRPLQRVYEPSRAFDVPVSVLDIALAGKEMGWRPRLTFREGVAKLVEALANGDSEDN